MSFFLLLIESFFVRSSVPLLAIVIYVYLSWISFNRLRKCKGPTLARFSSLWLFNAIGTKRADLELFDVSEKCGDLARIGPDLLLTGDAEVVIRMNAARSRYTKSNWYAGQKVEADHDNMFSTLDETRHSKRRAQMAIGYAGKEIDGLEAMVNKHMLQLITLIKEKYISDDGDLEPLDLARKASFFTMDAITEVAFGYPWGCLTTDSDVDKWFESIDLMMPANNIRASTLPWLASIFSVPFIGKMIMPSDKDPIGPGKLLGIAREIVAKSFQEADPGGKRDMMGSFIRHGVTQRECVSEATLQLAASVDTTATTIRATLLYLMTKIQIYKTLQAEIDSFYPSHYASNTNIIISDEQAKTLPYLQAVIKEGGRMWPPGTSLMSKVVPPEGDTINGVFVPGGTEIGQCAWAMQRSKKVFGEDSNVFRPERWLEAKEEKLERMERTFGLLWGYGKYSCPGKIIALMELNKVFSELLRNFDFALMDPSQPWVSHSYGLWLQKDMYVRATLRHK